MDIGNGVALGSLCISGGAVAITAIRTFGKTNGKDGTNGKNGANGKDGTFPCVAHSGFAACLDSIEKGLDRHEEWMKDISSDIKLLLRSNGNGR